MSVNKPITKFVRPYPKTLKVPNPDTGTHLLEEGELVVWSSYWQRRADSKEIKVADEAPQDEASDKTKHHEAAKVSHEQKASKAGGK